MPPNNGETGILFERADMKIIETLFVGCIIIAVIQWIIILLYIAFILILLWGVLFKPREMFGLLVLCLCAKLIQAYPAACIAVAALLVLVEVIGRGHGTGISQGRLTGKSEPGYSYLDS
jgi:hypothetical protein